MTDASKNCISAFAKVYAKFETMPDYDWLDGEVQSAYWAEIDKAMEDFYREWQDNYLGKGLALAFFRALEQQYNEKINKLKQQEVTP